MIKPFEFIKVLVSSVCTVPNARNTRRSTALGETPLIWYCARYPEPSNPTVDSVSVGCGCGTQRGSVHLLFTQFHSIQQFAACTVQQLLLPLCRVFPTVSGGLVAWRESKFWKGVSFLKFQSLLLQSATIKKWKKRRKKKNQESNQLRWTSSMDGRKVYGVYCTMNCLIKVKLCSSFPPKTGWPYRPLGFITNWTIENSTKHQWATGFQVEDGQKDLGL